MTPADRLAELLATETGLRWRASGRRASSGDEHAFQRTTKLPLARNVRDDPRWPRAVASAAGPVALEQHALWASAVADALETCRGSTIALVIGDIPDRRLLPEGTLDEDADVEAAWTEIEGATLPPGYLLLESPPEGFAWRWGGERAGREPWSWPKPIEEARREAWADFWCRRPSLTSGA